MSTLIKEGLFAKSPPFENTEVAIQFRAFSGNHSKWKKIVLNATVKLCGCRYFLSDQDPRGSGALGISGNPFDGWELAGGEVVVGGSAINIRTGETVTGGWAGFSPSAL